MMTVLTDKTKDHCALFRQAEKFHHSGNALDCSVLIVLSACVWSSGRKCENSIDGLHPRKETLAVSHWEWYYFLRIQMALLSVSIRRITLIMAECDLDRE